MKIWIDDIRPAPEGYYWIKSVNYAKQYITYLDGLSDDAFFIVDGKAISAKIELINIDHDAGEYAEYGGDYINLLTWLEQRGRNYPIHIHSMNPVGVQNMRAIIQKNGWKEV